MSNPWETEEGKVIWPNDVAYFTWLRGALRRLWADYPLRKEWKRRKLRPVTKEEKDKKVFHPSTKNVGQCALCLNWFSGSNLECDHIIPSDGCKNKEEAISFLWHCVAVLPDQLQLVCKPCHKIKSYADRMNISFEEARIAKMVIEVEKTKSTEEIQKILEKRGLPFNNAKVRREGLSQLARQKLTGDSYEL